MIAREYLDNVIATTQKEVNKYTYPIFVCKNEKPDLIASSVIIEIEKKYYLITASHVIAQAVSVDTPFIIGVNCKYISVSGKFVCSKKPNTDNFDIAYIQLAPQFIDENNIKPLESKRLLLRKILSPCHIIDAGP